MKMYKNILSLLWMSRKIDQTLFLKKDFCREYFKGTIFKYKAISLVQFKMFYYF